MTALCQTSKQGLLALPLPPLPLYQQRMEAARGNQINSSEKISQNAAGHNNFVPATQKRVQSTYHKSKMNKLFRVGSRAQRGLGPRLTDVLTGPFYGLRDSAHTLPENC